MDRPLKALANRFRFNDTAVDAAVGDFGFSDWRHRPEQGGNSAVWILGHMARYRRMLARKVGAELPEEKWEEEFAIGKPCRDAAVYPPAADLLREFHATGAILAERLEEVDPAAAAAPFGRKFGDGSEDIGGSSHYLHAHECLHLGQLQYIRRMRGLPGKR